MWHCIEPVLEDLLKDIGKPLGPAVYGYQPGGRALTNLDATEVPAHAIVGVAPSTSSTERALNLIFRQFRLGSIDSLLGGDYFHDTIVQTESQRGDITGENATRRFDNVVHAAGRAVVGDPDASETTAAPIFEHVRDLLLAQVESDRFGRFPRKKHFGDEISLSEDNDCPVSRNAVASGTQLAVEPAVRTTFEPPEDSVYAPGETIRFSFNVIGGDPLESALFVIDGGVVAISRGTMDWRSFGFRSS